MSENEAIYQTERAIERVAMPDRNLFEQCLRFANHYVTITTGKFSSEDLIYLHQVTHKHQPAEKRVWGSVIVRLQKEGKIVHAGFGKYRNPKGHCKPVNMWLSTCSAHGKI